MVQFNLAFHTNFKKMTGQLIYVQLSLVRYQRVTAGRSRILRTTKGEVQQSIYPRFVDGFFGKDKNKLFVALVFSRLGKKIDKQTSFESRKHM